jgi:beta-mannosidase
MPRINLDEQRWTLEGWRPFAWMLGRNVEGNFHIVPDIGPIEAQVPGSVQHNLRRAGVLPDWNEGVNSRQCEWVEHRHWYFETVLPPEVLADGGPVVLAAEGLDYSGWIMVDGREAVRFEGVLVPHLFDLSAHLTPGTEHRLGIVFEEPPREQGQMGYTSRSHFFKPRYPYSWDWCPRLVPVGIWDSLTLLTGPETWFSIKRIQATLDEDNRHGGLVVEVETASAADAGILEVVLFDGEVRVAAESIDITPGRQRIECGDIEVKPWWPNGSGDSHTYQLFLTARDAHGKRFWTEKRVTGFKRVAWQVCEGAVPGAEPWICVVNGQPVFLQGANWVPPLLDYHSATEEDYRRLIDLYREMGCNVLRVWGGGILEREVFYRLCDQAGILVWQEFPLSSSGVENYPPEEPEAIDRLVTVAESYIRRRSHHVSLLLWCGGNELTERTPEATPIGYNHPCIAALQKVVAREDPGRRFLPTSASGPQFYAHAKNYGQGIHHDVHGPWGMGEFKDLDAWRAYWEGDDALFRSEVGMPGASSEEILKQFSGGMALWPPRGEYWIHGSAWWIQWDRYRERLEGLPEEEALREYVRLTQEFQAEAYAIAAKCCKERFPRCGGFIIWMGHDLFPCPANNAVIDFLRQPKPAYFALQRVFREV